MNVSKFCFAVLVFITLAAAASAFAATCSDATLKGVYGYIFTGFGGDGTPRALVGQATADGKGNFSGTVTKSKDGTIIALTFTGTYSVAKNCTGSLTFIDQDGETRDANFVFDNAKKGWQAIQTDSGRVISGFGLAEGAALCGATGKKQTFAVSLTGTNLSVGPVAAVGQVIFDGKGNVAGSLTLSLNGSIDTLPITGTYTENGNCTGTAQITPQGLNTANFNFVVVNVGKEILMIETDNNTIVSGNMQQ